MTHPAIPDEVTTAASIVGMEMAAAHLRWWYENALRYDVAVTSPYAAIGDENWQLVCAAVKKAACAMMPESKLFDAAFEQLVEAAQDAAAAAKGVG